MDQAKVMETTKQLDGKTFFLHPDDKKELLQGQRVKAVYTAEQSAVLVMENGARVVIIHPLLVYKPNPATNP